MILNALFVSSVSYWVHLLVRSLTWWWKCGFSQLQEMVLQQPLWLEQWTLSALLTLGLSCLVICSSLVHTGHSQGEGPPPASQPQSCPALSDAARSPCLWREGAILRQSNIPAALASITSFSSYGLIYTVFFPQLFDCFQRQHGDRGQKET